MYYDPEFVTVMFGGREITGFAVDNGIIEINKDSNAQFHEPIVSIEKEIIKVHYSVIGAGPVGHPQEIFSKICKQQNWKVVEATPHTIGDCWIFDVQTHSNSHNTYLPSYIKIVEDSK